MTTITDDYIESLPEEHPMKEVLKSSKKEYDKLKAKAIKGDELSVYESRTLCSELRNNTYDTDNINIFSCCQDFTFWFTYLTYYINLAGGIKYYKYDHIKANRLMRAYYKQTGVFSVDFSIFPPNEYMSEVSATEVDTDLNYLYQVSDTWEKVIANDRHTDKLLQEVAKEGRAQLKSLKKSVANIPFETGKLTYLRKKRGIILRSKYLYLSAKDALEQTFKADLIINFLGHDIEITEFSIIHIIGRHFAAAAHQYPIEKTYHTEEVDPKKIHEFLGPIFNSVNVIIPSGATSIEKIMFEYKSKIYIIYASLEKRSIKGVGIQTYRRLNTFFPASKDTLIDEGKKGYSKVKIDDNLSIYIIP